MDIRTVIIELDSKLTLVSLYFESYVVTNVCMEAVDIPVQTNGQQRDIPYAYVLHIESALMATGARFFVSLTQLRHD